MFVIETIYIKVPKIFWKEPDLHCYYSILCSQLERVDRMDA